MSAAKAKLKPTSATIERQIDDWRGRLATLVKDRDTALAGAAEAKQKSDAVVLRALAEGDAQAKVELDIARQTATKSQLAAEDFATAVDQATKLIDELVVDRDAALRDEARLELIDHGATLIKHDVKIQAACEQLVDAVRDRTGLARLMNDESTRHGFHVTSHVLERAAANFLMWRFGQLGLGVFAPVNEQFRQPLEDTDRQILAQLGRAEDKRAA